MGKRIDRNSDLHSERHNFKLLGYEILLLIPGLGGDAIGRISNFEFTLLGLSEYPEPRANCC